MSEVQITTLANGLRVVSDRVDHVETVSVGVWIGAGTRSETKAVNGAAHLLEHMVFKGTERRSARDIAEEIEAVGGHLNAHTAREHTAYYAKILKNDTALAVDVLADILQNSLFDADELTRERAVVLQEIGQAIDTPDDIIFDHFQAKAYPDQPLGRPVLGSAEVIKVMPRDVLIGYQQGHYVAGDMVLAASGNLQHEALVKQAESVFGGLRGGSGPGVEKAAYVGGEFREHRDLEQVHIALGFKGCAIGDDDFYALMVMSNLLGGGMSSRLFQEIREQRGLVYSIHSFNASYKDNGMLGIYAGTGESEVTELIPVLCDELAGLAGSVREDEVLRSRTQLKAALLMGLESTGARCEQLAQHLLVFGRVLGVDEISGRMEAVDLAAVQRVARAVFSSNPTLAVMGPVGKVERLDSVAGRLAA